MELIAMADVFYKISGVFLKFSQKDIVF